MKKIYKTIGTTAMMAAFALSASAQQLPNGGFDNWKTACDKSEAFGTGGMTTSPVTGEFRVRAGVEPQSWNGSNINQKVFLEKKEAGLVTEGDADGNKYACLKNMFVGVSTIGSNAPGYITLGTPWVFAVMALDECDGGTYGGVEFTYKPDAIAGKYKRVDSNDEDSYIIAYLWNGTFKSNVGNVKTPTQERENVDRAIFGKTAVNDGSTGKLVASINHAFKSTANGDWEEIVLPFEYVEGAGDPEMMNVVICAGDYWTRGNLNANTNLLVDDVRFVYYSRLKSLTIAGTPVELTDGKYEYDMSGAMPTESEVAYELLGRGAKATVAIEGNKVVVTVNNADADNDGLKEHVYTLNYAAAPSGEVKKYDGYLTVDMGTGDISDNAPATVEITPVGDGKCDFLLPNLSLGDLGVIGDIEVKDVEMTVNGNVTSYKGHVDGMKLLGGEIVANVDVVGTTTAEGKIDMKIDVLWVDMNMPIKVTFKSEKESGVEGIEADANAPVEYYNLQGVSVNADNLVPGIYVRRQGSKVEKVIVK